MRTHITTLWLALAIGIALAVSALAHPAGYGQRSDGELRAWTNVITGETAKTRRRIGSACVVCGVLVKAITMKSS